MNIDIRKYIKSNFANGTADDIKQSIEEAIRKGDEITLPGLGFFFETLWNNSSDEEKNNISNTLQSHLK